MLEENVIKGGYIIVLFFGLYMFKKKEEDRKLNCFY